MSFLYNMRGNLQTCIIYNQTGGLYMETIILDNLDTEEIFKEYIPSNADLADMCQFFSVFTDVTRMKMLAALSICELCVSDLAYLLKFNQTTVSHQLKILRDAGMVATRRDGKIIYYRVTCPHINEVMLTGATYLCDVHKKKFSEGF